jgi:hypothetical protein
MQWVGYAAAVILGVSLGMHFGRLLVAIIVHWQSAAQAVRGSMKVAAFLMTGGGGAAGVVLFLFAHENVVFYAGGLGLGMIYAYFHHGLTMCSRLMRSRKVTEMQWVIPKKPSDPEQQALLALLPITPPKAVQWEERMSEQELEKKIGDAIDALDAGLSKLPEQLEALPEPHRTILQRVFHNDEDIAAVAADLKMPLEEALRCYREAVARLDTLS